MPWIHLGQELSERSAFKICCCHEYKPCREIKCTTCTRSGGTQTRTLSTKSHKGRLISWSSHAALYTALLRLLALTRTQFAIPSQDQATWGEPRPRPRAQALRMCPRPQFTELSVKATSLQNPCRPWPTSVRNLHTIYINKPQACMRWTDEHPRTKSGNKGKPGLAPCNHQASQVEQPFMQLTSEVAKTHEGRLHDTNRNLRQGPQHTRRSSAEHAIHPLPVCLLDTVMPKLTTAQHPYLPRRGEPVTAPTHRKSCQCALPTAARMRTWECIRDYHLLPGIETSPSGNAGPIKLLRTDARACSILARQLRQTDTAILLLHCTIAQLVNSLLWQQVLQSSAGLSRIEPLIFHQRETATLRDLHFARISFK